MLKPQFNRIQDSTLTGKNSLGKEYSYQDIFAHWKTVNLPTGSTVIIMLPNSALLLKHFFAVLKIGLVPVLLAPNLPRERLMEIVTHFNANAIVKVHVVEDLFPQQTIHEFGAVQIAVSNMSANPLTQKGEVILMTSGTSGVSSGCVFDFSMLIKNAKKNAKVLGLTKEDIVLVNLPLYYSYAFVAQALSSMVIGAKLIICGPPFNLDWYRKTIQHYQVTASSLTPILAKQIVMDAIKLPNSLRLLTIGGDRIGRDYVKALLALLPGKEIYLTYGLTQAGPRVFTLAAHSCNPELLETMGEPLPGTQIFLDQTQGPEGVGELLIESDTVMKRRIGIVDRNKKNELVNRRLHTGDLFQQDANGNLAFYSRKNEFISIEGEKVCLASIKRIVKKLPNVLTAMTKVVEVQDHTTYDLTVVVHKAILNQQQYIKNIHQLLPRSHWPHDIRFEKQDSISGLLK
jgi:acyl-CoA synthetase (AMP-forming)/AMP-acid ligase II